MFNKKYTVTGVYNYASPSIDKGLINGKRCTTLIASNWGSWMKGRNYQDPAVFALFLFGDDFPPMHTFTSRRTVRHQLQKSMQT